MNAANIQSIEVTENASIRILDVIKNNNESSSKFRVYVTGGGCSGFQYGFKFDSEVAFDDDEIKHSDFSILLDSMSYPYLYGYYLVENSHLHSDLLPPEINPNSIIS